MHLTTSAPRRSSRLAFLLLIFLTLGAAHFLHASPSFFVSPPATFLYECARPKGFRMMNRRSFLGRSAAKSRVRGRIVGVPRTHINRSPTQLSTWQRTFQNARRHPCEISLTGALRKKSEEGVYKNEGDDAKKCAALEGWRKIRSRNASRTAFPARSVAWSMHESRAAEM